MVAKAQYRNAWPYVDGRRLDLPVKNVTEAVAYYTDKLGFREVSRTDNPVPGIILERDGIQIGIAENGGDPEQEGCFFEVDSIETALKELQSKGLDIKNSAITRQMHGTSAWNVFFLVAPDGLCYCIGEKA